jgi:D-amino-acid oxidase
MKPNVAIIGAGVSGLTSGIVLAEDGCRVSIFAEEIGSRTTSAAAAAIWYPYDAEPADAVIAWSLVTFKRLRELAQTDGSGVSMIELRQLARVGEPPIPEWAIALGARKLDRGETPPAFTNGFALSVPLTDTSLYIDYLARRFRSAGGVINECAHIDAIADISSEFEIVVNCSGIGAQLLVPDSAMEPHRGQVVLVPKINVPYAIVSDDPPLMYAIPRANDCVFGGTNQVSDNRKPDAQDTARILAECSRVLAIDPPPVLSARVGLRPFRKTGVRLEAERLADGRRLIHNYGHGGSGFTLSWGCAEELLRLM